MKQNPELTFKEKVQGMTGKEIVMAMVNGLKRKWVSVDMITFGGSRNGVCYGCAATNTICEINGSAFPSSLISEREGRAAFLDDTDIKFISQFEDAIDCLRMGEVDHYNWSAKKIGISELPLPEKSLPILNNTNYMIRLRAYESYAESL